jgi:hypothetical protein
LLDVDDDAVGIDECDVEGDSRIPHPERPHLRCSVYEKHAVILGQRVAVHEALRPQLFVVRYFCGHLDSTDADLRGSDFLTDDYRNRLIRRDTPGRTTCLAATGENGNGQQRGKQRDPFTDSPHRMSAGSNGVDHDSQSG